MFRRNQGTIETEWRFDLANEYVYRSHQVMTLSDSLYNDVLYFTKAL